MILLAAAGFGTLGIFGKLAIDAGLNNPTLLTFRFGFATAILCGYLYVARSGPIPDRGRAASIVGLGLAYAVITGAFFWGLLYIPAGVATIVLYTYPIYVYAFSTVFLEESITGPKIVALLSVLLGIGLIVGVDRTGAIAPIGVGLVWVSAVAYAVYTTGSRYAVDSIEPDYLATGAIATTGVCVFGYGVVSGTLFVPSGARQWGIILGIALAGTVVPILLFVNGLRFVEASRASVLATAEPVTTVVLGVVVLGERLSAEILLGGSLVVLGVVIVQYSRAGRSTE